MYILIKAMSLNTYQVKQGNLMVATEEVLRKNINNLQEQLVHANKRVVALGNTVSSILAIQKDIDYHLQGIDIYIDDIRKLIDEKV